VTLNTSDQAVNIMPTALSTASIKVCAYPNTETAPAHGIGVVAAIATVTTLSAGQDVRLLNEIRPSAWQVLAF